MAYNKLKAHEYYMKHRKLKGKKNKKSKNALAGVGFGSNNSGKAKNGIVGSSGSNIKPASGIKPVSGIKVGSLTSLKSIMGAKSTSTKKKKKKSSKKR